MPTAALRQDRSEFNVVFVHSALDDLGLSPAQFRVYCHLARRANTGSGIEGRAWPAVPEMARCCRLHEDTVRTALRWLAAHRLLTRERRPGATSVYRLTAASHWLRPDPSESDTPPSVSGDTPPNPMGDHPSEKEGDEGYPIEGDPLKEPTHPVTTFVPPSLEEVLQAAAMRAIPPECAEKFFHEQTANEWRNRGGHPLRQWTAKLQAYAVSWRAVDHQRAVIRAAAKPAPRRGALVAVAPAAAFASSKI